MSRKGIILLAALFGAVFLLLAVAGRGYREVEAMQSLEKATAAVRREHPGASPIPPALLAGRLENDPAGVVLIDARDPEEYGLSRLAGAVCLGTRREIEEHFVGDPPDPGSLLVVYDSVGFRSAKLVEEIAASGLPPAVYLDGGIFAWANEGRPLVDEAGEPTEKVHPFNKLWGRLLEPAARPAER